MSNDNIQASTQATPVKAAPGFVSRIRTYFLTG